MHKLELTTEEVRIIWAELRYRYITDVIKHPEMLTAASKFKEIWDTLPEEPK